MATNRDIFSKHLPNIKLATRYDADGKEIQVERREDVDAKAKEEETFDMLVAAGYYRARIKGLSAFDKVVGGMTWCIECCDYDVDVDLLFHENLTIGQKIQLVEKIVSVLPLMKCPFRIEPHQIQGLEFLSIHPVIQWLVKKSVENRAERAQRLKKFAIGQFHNNYQYYTDKINLCKIRNASTNIKRIQELYAPSRIYQRREADSDNEKQRVRMTLLEYGHKFDLDGSSKKDALPSIDSFEAESNLENEESLDEFVIENRLQKLLLSEKNTLGSTAVTRLDPEQRHALQKHYKEFKQEMDIDAKQLSEQSQMKILMESKEMIRTKLESNETECKELELELERQKQHLQTLIDQKTECCNQMEEFKRIEENCDPVILEKVQALMERHDQLKKEETEFKEHCREDLISLQTQIDELEEFNNKNPKEQAAAVSEEKNRIQELKLLIAKKNRGIVAIQRQLDAIPDRTELTQYQRRFHELYNEMSSKHLETKQYYTLYNTLNDKKRYMEKELSLLNSICEAYSEGVISPHGREDFIQQFESILSGVRQTEEKVRRKYNEERLRRDALNDELQSLLELQRQYAAAVKQLTQECQLCEQLQEELKSIREHQSLT